MDKVHEIRIGFNASSSETLRSIQL